MGFSFRIEKRIKGKLGRAGVISTPHGVIHTPVFVAVGTKATVKALDPADLKALGAEVVLANAYHLALQPGENVLAKAGGLAKFMHWEGPTMTDSGGFQVMSLSPDIDEDGVTFRSQIDGSLRKMTPEDSVDIQQKLGADIIFAFDQCVSADEPYEKQKEAMERTHLWARRSLARFQVSSYKLKTKPQALFGIVQGGRHKKLREESARVIGSMDFDGFGIGGSFEKRDMGTTVRWVNKILPEEKPRHLLGIGEPQDLLLAIEAGADTFDCVLPTRIARNGSLLTREGRIDITKSQYAKDFSKIEKGCDCCTCRDYSRAYLRHLFKAHELLAYRLATIHNLRVIVRLVSDAREAILAGRFASFLATQRRFW